MTNEEAPGLQARIPEPVSTKAKSTLEALATAVVPGTVLCYLVGFLASAPHFARAGVPVSAISPQAFVAAGILCTVLTAPVVLVTLWGLSWWHSLTTKQRFLTAGLGLALPFVLLWQMLPFDLWPRVLLFTLAVQISMLTVSQDFVVSIDRTKLIETAQSISKLTLALAVSLGFFGGLIYPVVPVEWGGGRPQLLVTVPVGHTHGRALAAHDIWAATTRCRQSDEEPTPERCRLIFRVHESSDYIFAAIVELPNACSTAPKNWASWPIFGGIHQGCFQRISNTDIPRLESGGTP
jgi:hypothetical protein